MVLNISQTLFFWVTVESFVHVVMRPVAKGLNSCQRGEGVGGDLCLVLIFCQSEKPLGAF